MKYQGEGKYIRRTGGAGSHGHCIIELSASERGSGVNIKNTIVNGEVPKEYFSSIETGIRSVLQEGYLAGYPITDVEINVTGGSYHNVDSKPEDFKQAGRLALKDACSKAPMTLLEPIADVIVDTPDEFIGSVIGDLTKRRGKIHDINNGVKAFVPVAELFGYATDLRSITQGRASFSSTPVSYEEVPKTIQQNLIK